MCVLDAMTISTRRRCGSDLEQYCLLQFCVLRLCLGVVLRPSQSKNKSYRYSVLHNVGDKVANC